MVSIARQKKRRCRSCPGYHYGGVFPRNLPIFDFFKALIFKFEQKKREALPCNWNTLTLSDKRLDPIFRWEDEDLILDNSLLDLNVIRNKVTPSDDAQYASSFEISFEKHVGVDFGWVSAKRDGTPIPGPNMLMVYDNQDVMEVEKFFMENGSIGIMSGSRGKMKAIIKVGVIKERVMRRYRKIPEPFDTDEVDPKSHAGTIPTSARFWRETTKKNSSENRIDLSDVCSWGFVNIKRTFEGVVGGLSRSLFIYSDAGGSTVVGNRMTDLLREVKFSSKGEGGQYFEPVHIQYIPVRNQVVDIIEVNVAETTGELARLGSGNTILTLHFKKT